MEAQMTVTRVGEEAEVVMMTDATHVVLETVPWMIPAETVTTIEEVGALAHDLGLPTDIIDQGVIDASGTNERTASLEIHVALEKRIAVEAKAPKPKSRVAKALHR